MAVEIKITTPAGFEVQVAAMRRRALVRGGEVVRHIADAGAPRRTGEMIAESRVELEIDGAGTESAAIIFGAFYSPLQEKGDSYEHAIGHAHFLELALLTGREAALEVVGTEIRRSLSGGAG